MSRITHGAGTVRAASILVEHITHPELHGIATRSTSYLTLGSHTQDGEYQFQIYVSTLVYLEQSLNLRVSRSS
jgi:hypothetical protein